MEQHELATIEATREAQDAWMRHVDEIAASTVFPLARNSYYVGANVPGKPRKFALYAGSQKAYRDKCDEIAAAGYAGFVFGTDRSVQQSPEMASR